MRFAAGILLIVFATITAPPRLAMAQEAEHISDVSVREADPRERRAFLSDAPAATADRVWLDDRVQPVSSATASLSEAVGDPASDQEEFTALSITGSEDVGFDECSLYFGNDACPCAYFEVGALFMQQVSRFADQPIVVDDNSNTTLLSTSNLNSNFNPGLYATIGKSLCGGRAVEFDYFGLFGSNASAAVARSNANEFLIFPNNLTGNAFVDMEEVRVDYSSSVQSFAVNLLCCCGCCEESCGKGGKGGKGGGGEARCRSVTWFAGARYLNIAERLNISTQRIVGGGIEEGSYNMTTNNNLYGAQLGASLRRTSGRFGWDATGFGGIFGNDAQQTQAATTFPNFPLRPTVSSSQSRVAFVGGINVSALYALNNIWNVKAGYNALWIEGLALAPDQLDFDFAAAQGGSQIRNGGGTFLHGANAGLEARW